MKLSEIEFLLNKELVLKNDIRQLIDLVVQTKNFEFESSELSFDITNLINEGVIVVKNNKWVICNNDIFHFLFLQYFEKIYEFELSSDIDSAFKFIKDVDNSFVTINQLSRNQYDYFEMFTNFILKTINKEHGNDFVNYALNLRRTSLQKNLYKFNSAFCAILSELDLTIHQIYTILSHLYSELQRSDGIQNIDVGTIFKALRQYALRNPQKATRYLTLCITQKIFQPNLSIGIIAGIYEVRRNKCRELLIKLQKDSRLHIPIILALSVVKPNSLLESKWKFDFLESMNLDIDEIAYYLPRFYVSLLENNSFVDKNLIRKCFKKLKLLLFNKNPSIKASILQEIKYLDLYDKEFIKLIIAFLDSKDYDPSYDNAISNVLSRRNDIQLFTTFFIKYSQNSKLRFSAKTFDSAIQQFKKYEPYFSKELIKLLIHDNGKVRFIGIRILTHLCTLHNTFRFTFDILTLTPIEQCKLWVSIMEEYPEPKYCLPPLLPLLRSECSVVRESFIYKVEELTQNYFSEVVKVLIQEQDSMELDIKLIIDRIQTKLDEFISQLSKKKEIKEINPFFTQSKNINLFQRRFHTVMNENTDKAINKNSIFAQFGTTVILAKGGGWKQENQEKISKLSTIRHNFKLPREAFIQGEYFDWEIQCKYSSNWAKAFKEWEVMISL